MRLFFALWPDAATRSGLDRWAEALHRLCGGRRMRSGNLHVTIAFLGSVDGGRLPALAAAAKSVASRRFELRLDRPGYWKHNRIAWLGASEIPAPLDSLAAELRLALSAAGFDFDPKPFVPHITLVRNARPPQELPQLDPVDWHVGGFALLASENDEEGVRYRIAAGPF